VVAGVDEREICNINTQELRIFTKIITQYLRISSTDGRQID
jgi:hypothetical protein